MEIQNKATRINLFDFKSVPMRTFHMTWFTFFLCFFGWFGIAPLMPLVRDDLGLTKIQIGNTIIASVAITVLARFFMGWVCDRIGPRKAYTRLLIFGSIPVMCIGFAQSYEAFLLFRLVTGAIGASFVITQYHTSVMFAPNVVGTANATTAGWGNLGNGVTQMVMPLILTAFLSLGVGEFLGWRLAMVIPGIALFVMGLIYARCTQDFPDGNIDELRASGKFAVANKAKGSTINNARPESRAAQGSFLETAKDYRVWVLFLIYGTCFGVELTINNIAVLYFTDQFHLRLMMAGLIAGLFGFMNIFARTLGGVFSDQLARVRGLKGRVSFLAVVLFLEGIMLVIFSRMTTLPLAIATLILLALFVQMSNGATYSVVPFINKRALGAVAGIVGAGGNAGAVAFGFLFRAQNLSYSSALFILGIIVAVCAFSAFLIRFSSETEAEVKAALDAALVKEKIHD